MRLHHLNWIDGRTRGLVSPDFREELTALRQIARLRLDPRDVRHSVLTQLDFDQAGGLDDFPLQRCIS